MSPKLALYDHSSISDDDFVQNFVARLDVLKTLKRRLTAATETSGDIHQVLIGARGMGKTSMLRRLAIEVANDLELSSKYVPLRFREEQYNVLHLRDFWRNCTESLAEWADQAGNRKLEHHLDRLVESNLWDNDEKAAEQFQAEITALDRRAILFVDNIDLILNALSPQDQWIFRRHLQAENGPVVIGAATQPLKETADREAPFYEFFQPHYLNPLDIVETRACMQAIAATRSEKGERVIQIVQEQPERLSTLHLLTGGNPRVLVLIYRLLESAESNEVMADLEVLLDQVTPYYKARIEEYQSPQQRAIIDAIALHWDPVTLRDLTQITGIKSTTLSSSLIKLRKEGLIEETRTSGSYGAHQIVERFLNIWYLMRHGTRRTKQRMRWLVGFLTSFYSAQELREISNAFSLRERSPIVHPDYAFAVESAIAYESSADSNLNSFLNNSDELQINSIEEIASPNDEADKFFHEVGGLFLQGEYDSVLSKVNEFITENPNQLIPRSTLALAKAYLVKGLTLGQQGEHAIALAVYVDLITRFGNETDPVLREQVAIALISKGNALDQLGEHAAEIEVYDDLVGRFENAPEPALRKQVAKALVNKGYALGQLGDHAVSLEVYDDLISRFDNATEPTFCEQVAIAQLNKGYALDKLGDHTASLEVYDDLIGRFDNATEPTFRAQVAIAQLNKGYALGQLGDFSAEIAVYDELTARFNNATEPAIRAQVAIAQLNKGITLGQLGDFSAEIAVYDELTTRFNNATVPAIREQVAKALCEKGTALARHGDMRNAVLAYDAILQDYSDIMSTDDDFNESVNLELANLLIDISSDLPRVEVLLERVGESDEILAKSNLAWLYLLNDRFGDANKIIKYLNDLPEMGMAIFRSALELASENFGAATQNVSEIMDGSFDYGKNDFWDDRERLLRLAEKMGYGERLISWFEETGYAQKTAPIYAAFKAYVRGEEHLLDVNPEVREPAQQIYRRLSAHRQNQPPAKKTSATKKRTKQKSSAAKP